MVGRQLDDLAIGKHPLELAARRWSHSIGPWKSSKRQPCRRAAGTRAGSGTSLVLQPQVARLDEVDPRVRPELRVLDRETIGSLTSMAVTVLQRAARGSARRPARRSPTGRSSSARGSRIGVVHELYRIRAKRPLEPERTAAVGVRRHLGIGRGRRRGPAGPPPPRSARADEGPRLPARAAAAREPAGHVAPTLPTLPPIHHA